jgi:hypothetical protein
MVMNTYAMTSADGPSRAGPISERVVKPEALDRILASLSKGPGARHTPYQAQGHIQTAQLESKMRVCSVF